MGSRGNKSRVNIHARDAERAADERLWNERKAEGLFAGGAYERADVGAGVKAMNARDLGLALNYLASVFQDEAFRTAALVFEAYKLDDTGVEAAAKRFLKSESQTVEDHIVDLMQADILATHKSDIQAARDAAIEYGVGAPGQSLDAVVDTLRKLLGKRHGKAPPNREALSWGNTGRRLRVRLTVFDAPDAGRNFKRNGVSFDAQGVGTAPDTSFWRNEIARGRAEFRGFAK